MPTEGDDRAAVQHMHVARCNTVRPAPQGSRLQGWSPRRRGRRTASATAT